MSLFPLQNQNTRRCPTVWISTSSRMNAIGRSMVMTGKIRTAEDTIASIEKVTMEDILEILPIVFDREKLAGSAVGKIDEKALQAVLQ